MSAADHDDGPAATREKRPTFVKGMVFLAVIAVTISGLGVFAIANRSSEGPLVPTADPTPIAVEVGEIELASSFMLDEQFSGLASPRRTSQLGFTNGGRVDRILVDIGDRVDERQLLARLDTRALQAQLASAEASISEARASHELALVTVRRQTELLLKGHVAQQRVDEARAQADTALARIEAASAQADLLRVQIDLATVRAPYAGVITARMMDEGAIAAQGAPVFELVENDVLEARIGLPAAAASTLDVGEVFTLMSDRGPAEARLRATTDVIDMGRRTVTAVFDILDASTVSAGAVVRLAVDRQIDERGFWAPVSALAESNRGLWSIYVLERDGQAYRTRPQLVEIVHSDGGRAFVRGPVSNGALYVVDGLQRLTPDQRVMPSAGATVALDG
ncbi:MAG: efflux RND transporter periplasmic adaptor subunit [Pseudomonadota bacterium]